MLIKVKNPVCNESTHLSDKPSQAQESHRLERVQTTGPGGALIYLKVFIKIAVSDRRKTHFLGRPQDLQADLDFYVVLKR